MSQQFIVGLDIGTNAIKGVVGITHSKNGHRFIKAFRVLAQKEAFKACFLKKRQFKTRISTKTHNLVFFSFCFICPIICVKCTVLCTS